MQKFAYKIPFIGNLEQSFLSSLTQSDGLPDCHQLLYYNLPLYVLSSFQNIVTYYYS
jgi:hypothetical protein